MAARNLASAFNIGSDVLGITRNANTGALSLNLGDSAGQVTDSNGAEWWQTFGFASLPSKPTQGKASAQIIALERNVDIAFAGRDVRNTSIYGQLDYGETCLYSGGPNGTGTNRFLLKDNGSIATQTMLCQAGNTSSGVPVVIQISSDDGGKFNIAAGNNGAISCDSTGLKFVSNQKMQIGGSDDFALIGKTIALNGGNVQLGSTPIHPIALATNLLPLLTAINTLASTLALGFTGVGAALPGTLATNQAAILAAANAVVALSGTIAQIASTTVKATA